MQCLRSRLSHIAQVLENMSRQQLSDSLAEVLPAVQAALCDAEPAVREAAGAAFAILFKVRFCMTVDSQ